MREEYKQLGEIMLLGAIVFTVWFLGATGIYMYGVNVFNATPGVSSVWTSLILSGACLIGMFIVGSFLLISVVESEL